MSIKLTASPPPKKNYEECYAKFIQATKLGHLYNLKYCLLINIHLITCIC